MCGQQTVRVLLEEALPAAEPPISITLLQSLVKGEKMDLIVRQAVELGVSTLIPVITGRSVPRWSAVQETRRLERWRAIARSAAAQCRRCRLPAVKAVIDFQRALAEIKAAPVALVPWEEEKDTGIAGICSRPSPQNRSVLVFIGPEGGLSSEEAAALSTAGAFKVHLGPRILRVETAAAVTLALVQAAWGDLGGRRER